MQLNNLFSRWRHLFWPNQPPVDRFERMRSCAGALFGIAISGALTYLCVDGATAIWLVAPMGASAVLLYVVPASPMAQPWAVWGGNMVSAIVGVTCAKLFAAPVIAAAAAVSLAIAAMFLLRCMHPPGGAMALTMVVGGPAVHAAGYAFVGLPVALNTTLMVVCALFYNRAIGRKYPHVATPPTPMVSQATPQASQQQAITATDLDAVLKSYNQVLDISRDDLQNILLQAEMLAYRRRFGETVCADIMREDVHTVEFGTELETAWRLLQKYQLKALTVTDRSRRVIGIVTPTDFLSHAGLDSYEDFSGKLQMLLKRSGLSHSNKPEVVGQIMTAPVKTARTDMPIIELLPLVSDFGLRHIPVVDEEGRLAGLLTQGDMVTALYGKRLANS